MSKETIPSPGAEFILGPAEGRTRGVRRLPLGEVEFDPFSPVRARGRIALALAARDGGTHLRHLSEAGGFRVKFPHGEGVRDCVILNTGGGLTGGDRLDMEVAAGPGAHARVTTQSAEKIYRSSGPDTLVRTRLELEGDARLIWLPQETILFSGARLDRKLDVALTALGRLTLVETVVFGRAAMGEVLGEGAFRDQWRVRRDGALVFAEAVRLEADLGALLARPALGGGAAAVSTLLHLSPEAESRLDEARALLSDAAGGEGLEAGASAWNGMLIVRLRGERAEAVRGALARFVSAFEGAPLPRVW